MGELITSLNISWSLTNDIEGVAVEFTLTATNLNDSTAIPIIESGITVRHQILTIVDTGTLCDVYSFRVIARNAAGSSGPSDNVTSSFPSLPDISPVEDSLQHSLVEAASGVILNVKFNVRK